MKKIAVLGLGYVGLPLAYAFSRQYQTVGFDIDHSRIEELLSGCDRTRELSKEKIQQAIKNNIVFTSRSKDIAQCNIFIVTVPTPIDDKNQPDLRSLCSASKMVGTMLKKDDIVVYESTVYPGCTEEECVPILEKQSGLQFNKGFFCGYSPERINPGDKIRTLENIVKVVSGSNSKTTETLKQIYSKIINAGVHIASSIKVAEAAKVIENTQRDLNIAFVNELSMIFRKLGIDTQEVLDAAGTKWNFLPFKPGLVGGHCIGVDPYYLTYKASMLKMHPQLILAGRKVNSAMPAFCVSNIIKLMIKEGKIINRSKVAVMGVTFKENCPDIRNSKVIDIMTELKGWEVEVIAQDPYADVDEVFAKTGIKLQSLDSIKNVDAVIFTTLHQQYTELKIQDILRFFKVGTKPILGDIKGMYDIKELTNNNISVFRL